MSIVKRKTQIVAMAVVLIAALGSQAVLAHAHGDAEARVVIGFAPTGDGFGAAEGWEASLYAGAEPGDETGGRFTAWVPVQNGSVAFDLPQDVRDGMEAPFGVEGDTYVRIRTSDDGYPTFDLVGAPFTLVPGRHAVSVRLVTTVTSEAVDADDAASILFGFSPSGHGFGASDAWEASLYAGAEAGAETGGRFSAWIGHEGGSVRFAIPQDATDPAPFGVEDDFYLRVRSTDGYPSFDLVTAPVTLVPGNHTVHLAVVTSVVSD